MGNESVPDCLNHKDSRNIQVRLDYMLLYRNEAKAKVIRTMETWTDTKRAEWYKLQQENKEQGSEPPKEPPEEALWVTMSYEEFSIYAYGTIKRDDIKIKVDELVHCKHLKRRPHPTMPGVAPQYLLNLKLLQKALDEQEMPSLFEDIGKIAPPRKKHTPREKYPQGRGINTPRVGGKIPPGTGEKSHPSNNTTENYEEYSKNEDTLDASASTRTQQNVIDFKKATDGRMKAVKGNNNDTTPILPVLDQPARSTVSDSMDAVSDSHGLRDIDNNRQLAQPQALAVQVDSSYSNDGYTKEEDYADDTDHVTHHPVSGDVPDDHVSDIRNSSDRNTIRYHSGLGEVDQQAQVALPDDEPTAKLPAVKKGQADDSGVDNSPVRDIPGNGAAGGSDSGQAQREGAPEEIEALGRLEQKPGASGAHFSPADTPPSVGTGDATGVQAPSSNAGTPARHSGNSPGTLTSAGAAQVKPVPKSDTREIQRRINEHRGYALEEQVEIIRERKAIKSWCNLHTLEDYEAVMLKLKTDPYWGKPENYYRIGGLTLAKETPKALAQPPPNREQADDTVISFDDYVGNGPEARELVLLEYEEHRKNGTLAW